MDNMAATSTSRTSRSLNIAKMDFGIAGTRVHSGRRPHSVAWPIRRGRRIAQCRPMQPPKKLAYQHVPHPTSPEGMRVHGKASDESAGGSRDHAMLAAWNTALQALRAPPLRTRNTHGAFVAYGAAFLPQELR